jgi:predicted Holliday junction resolvase-like endonuclease
MPPSAEPLVTFLAGALVAAIVTAVVLHRRASVIRAEALAQSRAVIRGQVSEQILPLLEAFPFEAADARFLGHPIDYVIFDGLAEDADDLEIVLVEVKTGGARLTRREAAVRDAVEAGRVRFEIVRV